MVKNTTGGNKSKGLARKHEHSSSVLRISRSPLEIYAVVRKVSGGNCCQVVCQDNISRTAIIRGKFSCKKNKRNHFISSGTIILVGLRDWASSHENDKCDILEVYGINEVERLKQDQAFPTELVNDSLRELFGDSKASSKIDGYEISTIEDIIAEEEANKESITLIESGEKISIDDI